MTTINTLARAWDSFDVYLFDIDGTLLHCADAVHYLAFCSVLEQIAGRPMTLEGVTAHGNTDVGILRDAFRRAGVEERHWRARLPEIKEAMCDYVRCREQELCASALPDVGRTLEYLRSKRAILGVATGNLREIGRLKLKRAGLLDYFQFGGWSDACETRAEVFRAAAEQARRIGGDAAAICVIGDTPADIAAARQNGLWIISVATGIYSVDTLQAESPDLCVASLGELSLGSQTLVA